MKKERIILIIFLICFAGLFIFEFRKNISLNEKIIDYKFYEKRVKSEIDSLKATLDRNEPRIIDMPELSELELSNLKRLGLYNPEADIKSDLLLHPELIPYKGVLGGTVGFCGKDYMRIINNKVFAYFGDGHIGGYMVLEYKVSPKGKIMWKVLYSHLEDGE